MSPVRQTRAGAKAERNRTAPQAAVCCGGNYINNSNNYRGGSISGALQGAGAPPAL